MKILFNDILQYSDLPKELKSPALSETSYIDVPLTIILDKNRNINSIGIGNINGTYFVVTINGESFNFNFAGNGLYLFNKTINTNHIIISTDATFIGRIGAGLGVHIPTSIAKEPMFASTSEPRTTLSGQIIPGVGGYNYRMISLDSRYKITKQIMEEIQEGYKYIGMGYPFFIDLTDESYKIPFNKLYATERNQRRMSFESGIIKYLYSRRWEFEERF